MRKNNSTAIAAAYVKAGFVLVPIPKGSKAPRRKAWSDRANCISKPQDAHRLTGNIGLAHLYSKTCVVDVDDFEKAAAWLSDKGVDLAALLMRDDAVQIVSGRPNRAKLLYWLPDNVDSLITHQVGGFIEFRCAAKAGTTVQDVLPPSIHPNTGQAYQWVGDWRRLPTLPDELLALWQSLDGNHREVPSHDESAQTTPHNPIPEGSRNLTLFKRAAALRFKGKEIPAIVEALRNMNALHCTPPLQAEEVQRIAESVGRYPKERARLKYIWRDWIKSPAGPTSPTTRHILLTLSDYMDADGGSCFPTIKTISAETAINERTVKQHIKIAVEHGWILRYSRQGEGQAWRNYGYIANLKVVTLDHHLNAKVVNLSAEGGEGESPYTSKRLTNSSDLCGGGCA